MLECAGYDIRLLKTEYVKHERDLAHEQLDADTDILVIAGGDTTVMNVLTGLNRRADFDAKFKNRIKIAILPLGATNRIWHTFSSQREGSFDAPYDRQNRITEAAGNIGRGAVCDVWFDKCRHTLPRRVKVRGNVAKADVLALTADNGKTLYTMGGLRWGAYQVFHFHLNRYADQSPQDIERRAPEYFLPPFWHKGKLMRAYMSAYLNGELDEPRKLLVKYAKDITEDEMAQHHQRELEKEQQIQMLTSQVKSVLTYFIR